jgi:hypothetical protein
MDKALSLHHIQINGESLALVGIYCCYLLFPYVGGIILTVRDTMALQESHLLIDQGFSELIEKS